MTAIAILRSTFVHAIHVARRACGAGVLARQRDGRGAVVEDGAGPLSGAVACFAGLREPRGHVIRIGSRLELSQVAGDARRRQRRVLAVSVAARARGSRMLAGQRESGRAVVEGRARPLNGAVTERAVLRESRSGVVRIGRRLIQRQVTCGTRGPQSCELAPDVTTRASGRRMLPG